MNEPAAGSDQQRVKKDKLSDDDLKLIERATRRGTAADIIGTMVFEGTEKEEIEDVLDIQMVLIEWRSLTGTHGEFVVLHMLNPLTGKHLSTVTGGQVVVRKVHELTDKKALPCLVTISKVKDYYDLT